MRKSFGIGSCDPLQGDLDRLESCKRGLWPGIPTEKKLEITIAKVD